MAFRSGTFVALTLLCATWAPLALAADPSPQEKETARSLMDEGNARRDAGDHPGALAQFQGADAIMHVPTTGLEVAREQAALGHLVEARETLHRILNMSPPPDEPEVFRWAREESRSLDEHLADRIPALRIRVSGVPEGTALDVAVDAERIPPAALIAAFKVNPGHHVVTATMRGGSAREEIDVTEGQTAAVTLNVVMTSAPPAPGSSEPRHDANPDPEKSARPSSAVLWIRWGGLGLAAAGLAVGAVTGAMSISATNAAKKSCLGNMCPPSTWDDIRSARTTAMISDVAFGILGAGFALVIVSFALGGSSHSKDASRPIAFWIGAGMADVEGALAW